MASKALQFVGIKRDNFLFDYEPAGAKHAGKNFRQKTARYRLFIMQCTFHKNLE